MKRVLLILATLFIALSSCTKLKQENENLKNRLDEAKRNVLRGYVRTIVAKVDKCNYILMTRDGGLNPNEAVPLKRIIDTTFTFNLIKEKKGADLVRFHAHIHLADKRAQREFTIRGVNYKVEELTVKDFRF